MDITQTKDCRREITDVLVGILCPRAKKMLWYLVVLIHMEKAYRTINIGYTLFHNTIKKGYVIGI